MREKEQEEEEGPGGEGGVKDGGRPIPAQSL